MPNSIDACTSEQMYRRKGICVGILRLVESTTVRLLIVWVTTVRKPILKMWPSYKQLERVLL